MHGAQVCYDLCGQHLFRLLTKIIYTRAKEPSEVHRAIAELAHAQDPGLFPGWDSIITYNIDAPRDRKGKEPDRSEIAAESAKYLELGVRPVWFDDFAELPGLIRQLQ
ncbi:MAG TPA: hypothetical protein VJM47_11540 [Nitrosospira sp.]|nr:hypothetical protein [Nitrosospira sp.]